MNMLSIDTTGNVLSVAAAKDRRIVASSYLDHKKTHSEGLMPMVDYVLGSAELGVKEIDCFASVVGPGSFTGIRIGVASIKAMAGAGDKPCVAVNTLDALAANQPYFDGVICPVMDARRAQVYNALYRYEKGRLNRICDYRAVALETLLHELRNEKTLFLGDGVLAYRKDIGTAMRGRAVFAAPNNLLQHAAAACVVGFDKLERKETVFANDLNPFYLRKPQAERVYEKNKRESEND